MPGLTPETRYPSLMFTENDRREAYRAIMHGRETGELNTSVLFRLFDQKVYGKSHQANVLLNMLIEACGEEAFDQESEHAYYEQAPRDAAGLISGYDQKYGAFNAGRLFFSSDELM